MDPPLPFHGEELYSALQQGTVDGAENNLPSFYSSKHYEVCKKFSLNGHTRIPDMVMVSEAVWNSLSPQMQTWLEAAAQDASRFQRELWQRESRLAMDAAKEAGVEFFTPEQAPFVESVQPMLESYKGTAVGDLLQQIRNYNSN